LTSAGVFSWLALSGIGLTPRYVQDGTLLHWASGRTIVETGRVPERDPFTFTASGVEWVNPGWLGDVLAYASFHSGGGELAQLTGLELALAASVLVLARTRRRVRSTWVGLAVTACVVRSLTSGPLSGPLSWAPFLAALTLFLLDNVEKPGRPIAIGCATAAAGHLLAMGSLLLLLPGSEILASAFRFALTGEGSGRGRRALLALLLGAIGCSIHPWGPAACLHPFRCLVDGPFLSGLAKLADSTDPFHATGRWLLALLAASLLAGRPQPLGTVLAALGAACFALASIDGLGTFVVVASLPLARCLDEVLERWRDGGPRLGRAVIAGLNATERPARVAARFAPVGLIVALAVATAARAPVLARGRTNDLTGLVWPDLARIVSAAATAPPSRFFNDISCGGALAFVGRHDAFFDERLDLAAQTGVLAETTTLLDLGPGFEEVLVRRRFDLAIVARHQRLDMALRARAWRPIAEDGAVALLARPTRRD
jgi:hypothetical protein